MNAVATLRTAIWTLRAADTARRQLRSRGLRELRLPRAPAGPITAERGVWVGLRLSRASCLVAAVVRQRWHLAQGSPRAIVVGVIPPSEGFQAHAWLEGDPISQAQDYHELLRHPAA